MKKLIMSILVALLMVGAVVTASAENTVTIASGNFAEPQILAEAVKMLIEENTDLSVNHVRNFSAISLYHTAFMAGEIDMYICWTGTVFRGPLEMEVTEEWKDRDKVEAFVQEQYDEQFDAYWFDSFGFNNTYAVVARRDWAEEHNVSTITDLEEYAADLSIGMDVVFLEQPGDGYNDLTGAYGFEFGRTVSMEYGLLYRAVAADNVDLAVAYSTDGRIGSMDLVVLEDDIGFFPPYDGALTVKNEVLAEYPIIYDLVDPLIGAFDDEKIAYYNQLVDVDYWDVRDAAEKMLNDMVRNK